MAALEDLRQSATVQGIVPGGFVTVVNIQWYGSDALELTYKDASGRVGNRLLYRHDEPELEVVEAGRPWSFDGDGSLFRLVSEAQRIRLAHLTGGEVNTSGKWTSPGAPSSPYHFVFLDFLYYSAKSAPDGSEPDPVSRTLHS